ncbi:MAG: bifunctional tetrahydrofolate synthase/dihydrofolate synthase [Arenicellales bacterium]|jgi:dihydrofolate synthase/folylpolyglutamate synthase|nr:bifunctional tetrahydrofolate synthase/dihydrofolate synthase [Arenicellales bacterium]MDP6289654.1 bifunctional tetrahydrofolate synthase/dihydrofolate synthase [Arenicellales bacterium]MDP7283517.1 bifunctional tetrahydrofolate synthase/dihydrofolate synthase [Arenicellales bacterium]|tara:strand:- start:1330 stop:2604 length:1275 start_codon:yes stop_codon:yes gene_type:complete
MRSLEDWLDFTSSLHPVEVDLGLDRVREVVERLLPGGRLPFPVITVAGTNGKGSCVVMLESILVAAGYSVGCYLSPHLVRFNERFRVSGQESTDSALVLAYRAVEKARGSTSLTYFEFATLAAFNLFSTQKIDVAILETGLGGRLDAVNSVDADAALITSIGLDHTALLGTTREEVGSEKAGVFRPGQPAVCADPDPPVTIHQTAETIGASLWQVDKDYGYSLVEGGWQWWSSGENPWGLKGSDVIPRPGLSGEHQIGNSAAVVALLSTVSKEIPVGRSAIIQGLKTASLRGRLEIISHSPEVIVDVAHNRDAAKQLSCFLQERHKRWTVAVFSMLRDKAIEEVVKAIGDSIDLWIVAGIDDPRGLESEFLARVVKPHIEKKPLYCRESVAEAYLLAHQLADDGDRIVVFGSFHTAGAILALPK